MENKKQILYDSPEAAQFKTGIEGWVSSDGFFFGKDERAEHCARYAGSTHRKCECGGITEKAYIRCADCRLKFAKEVYDKMPYKEWDTKEPICLYGEDEFFFNEEALMEYLYDHELNGSDVQLVLCQPMRYQPIDGETIAGDAHEDWEPSKELEDKMKQFNEFLASLPPHSWYPGKFRTSYDYIYNSNS